MSEHHVVIRIRDRHGNPLPGANVQAFVDTQFIGGFYAKDGHGSISIDGHPKSLRIVAEYNGRSIQEKLSTDSDECIITFPTTGDFSPMGRTIMVVGLGLAIAILAIGFAIYLGHLAKLLPLTVGSILVAVATLLAFTVPNANPLQSQIIRGMFALGLGGCASQVPGLLNVNLAFSTTAVIAAGGAIAVYVITFFFKPAGQ